MANLDNIFVIDDDPIYQLTFKSNLEAIGFNKKVKYFSDGEEAINFLQTTQLASPELPDIIFLDINMPVMDGWDFIEAYIQIKPQLSKQIIIYMVSSSVDPRDIERAKKIGEVSDYLIKPITRSQLIQIFELDPIH